MRLLIGLFGLVAVSISYAPVGNGDLIGQFDCSGRSDGIYAVAECLDSFVQCVAGLGYSSSCPENLVYVASKKMCDHPSVCSPDATQQDSSHATSYEVSSSEVSNTPVRSKPTDFYHSDDGYQDSIQMDIFDCSNLPDGSYSHGCTPFYTICSFGVSSQVECPVGLLFDEKTDSCEWPSRCGPLESSTLSLPTDTPVTRSPNVVVEYPGTDFDSPFVPAASGKCSGSDVSAYGDCSSKFKRCRSGIWSGARCPGATVFDPSFGLCVYDLPRCNTDIFNPAVPTASSVAPSAALYYGDQHIPDLNNDQIIAAPYVAQQMDASISVPENDLLSNPFFALRHKAATRHGHRRRHDGEDNREKVNNLKLRYPIRSTKVDDLSHYVEDQLNGKAEPYIHQDFHPTFPRSFKSEHKIRLDKAWESLEIPKSHDYGEKPVGDTLDKGLELEDYLEGSGLEGFLENPDTETRRDRRSYSLDSSAQLPLEVNLCSSAHAGLLLSLGSCRQDFILCLKSTGQIRAACPEGDLFDGKAMICVPQEDCGERLSFTSDIPITASTVLVTSTDSGSIDNSIVSDPCEGRLNGPLALGCSVSYVMCENNVGVEMACPGGLVFDEGRNICDHRGNVAICGGSLVESSSFADSSSRTILPSQVYLVAEMKPYRPSLARSDSSDHISSNAYQPLVTTPKYSPYIPSTLAPIGFPSTVATEASPSATDFVNESCARFSIGYHQSGICSPKYIYCWDKSSKAVLMTCPSGLVYSADIAKCLRNDQVKGCPEYSVVSYSSFVEPSTRASVYDLAATHQLPIQVDQTTSSYGFVKNEVSMDSDLPVTHQLPMQVDQTTSYGFVENEVSMDSVLRSTTVPSTQKDVIIYSPSVNENMASSLEGSKCASDKPTAFGKCDGRYTVCSNGIDYVMSCGHPLVFDSVRQTCDRSEFVQACSETVYFSSSSTAPLAEVSTEVPCNPNVDSSPSELGFCSNQYRVCSPAGFFSVSECALGFLFDKQKNECVEASECGVESNNKIYLSSSSAAPLTDPRCYGKFDNSFISNGDCSSSYVHCLEGKAAPMKCRQHEIFSDRKGRCVARFLVRECSKNIKVISDGNDEISFCKVRPDGLYRNPSDCTSILQCFGGVLFKTSGCASGLVFNEDTKQCDYRQNVPGCEAAVLPKKGLNCDGFEHGAYVADKSDCTVFYRCVWNRLEKLHCPRGTVFNPVLSVCDWISNVPSCKNNDLYTNLY